MPPADMPRLARRQSSAGKRRANETAEGVPNVSVGLGQGVGLKRGRDGSARINDLGPSCARAEESEGPVSILVLADCMKKGDDALATPWTEDVQTTCDLRWRPQSSGEKDCEG